MAYVAIDQNGSEIVYECKPIRTEITHEWELEDYDHDYVRLPKGSIEKLIGHKLTWEDEPVELKEQS